MNSDIHIELARIGLSQIKKIWEAYNRPILKNTLYHYTTADGIMGIIKSNSLWATNIDFLNDPNELNYGINLCNEILSEISEIHETFKISLQMFLISLLKNRQEKEIISELYIVSFCERQDVLGQWRLYGNYGKGYCVGINFENDYVLIPEINDGIEEVDIPLTGKPKPIIYDIDLQKKLIIDIITKTNKEIITFSKKNKLNLNSDDSFHILKYISRYIIENILPFIKKPEFSDEREWRIVIEDLKEIYRNYRTDNNIIIPYCILKFFKDGDEELTEIATPINEIIIGQALNYQRSSQGLRWFLRSNEILNCPITRSNIEFV